jgi:serine/threonine-protein kinase
MSDTPPPQTRVIGRYSILRELRRERHSVSYAAVDPVMNRQLVLKAVELLPAGPRLNGEERLRVEQAFVRQAQAAGRLQHPHIVTVFDAGLSHAFGFLVIERVNGRPLHELLAGGLRPAFVQCASIGARIADALECAHANGVAHGHLGPQHVYLQADGSPKISGFGGWIDDGASGDEALAGTERLLPYFQNEINEESRRHDLQALGQLLYMMLCGRAPPEAARAEPAGAPRAAGAITRAGRPDTPPVLAALVDQALSGGAEGPRTAAALRDALTAFIWNERTENVAPNSLGIPLAAPPARAPVHVATITPEENVPPLREPAPAAPAPAPTLTLPPTRPAALAPQAALPAAVAPAPAAAGVPAGAAAPARGTLPARPGEAAAEPSYDLQSFIETLRPWALRYRLAIFGVGAFFFLAIFLGVLLGNLRHAPAAASASPAESAQAAAPAAPVPQTRAPVSFDLRPWGEVLIDGKPTGVAPPMTQTEISGGHHHIEIRHDPAAPWSVDVDVRDATPIRIEHGFE